MQFYKGFLYDANWLKQLVLICGHVEYWDSFGKALITRCIACSMHV